MSRDLFMSRNKTRDFEVKVKKSFVEGSLYGVLLQILCKIVTFYVNIIVIRKTDIEVLGLVNVKMMLLQSTIIFLTREPYRKVLGGKKSYKEIEGTISLIPKIGIVISIIMSIIWIYMINPETDLMKEKKYMNYKVGVIMIMLSALVEIYNEKYWYISRIEGYLKMSIMIEGISNIYRALLILITVKLGIMNLNNSILILTGGILLQSICCYLLNMFYFSFYIKSVKSFKKVKRVNSLNSSKEKKITNEIEAIKKFFKQTIIKQIITEGERYIMTITTYVPLIEQGIYDIIMNLTSLIPRLLFAPIEESIYQLFLKMLPRLNKKRYLQQYQDTIEYFNKTQRIFVIIGMGVLFFGVPLSIDINAIYFGDYDKVTIKRK